MELVIAEKFKAGIKIAKALYGRGRIESYEGVKYIVSPKAVVVPLRGHITEYDTKGGRFWSSFDPMEIITNHDILVKKYDLSYKRAFEEILFRYGPFDRIIEATDADEEGENIGMEAIELLRTLGCNAPVKRMWMHSLQPDEIRRAYRELEEPKRNLAEAVEARRMIDAIVGFSGTREITLALRGRLKKLGTKVLSIGRVQTPTLAAVIKREKEIRSFRPKPFWRIKVDLGDFSVSLGPFYAKEEANKVFRAVSACSYARVERVESRKVVKRQHPPLNTDRALRLINRYLGMPAKRAMQILESLYLSELISYPRTATDRYGRYNVNHREILRWVSRKLGKKIPHRLRVNGKKDAGDHPPITPLKEGRGLRRGERAVFEFIVRHYASLFLPPAKLVRKKAILDLGGEKAIVEGYEVEEAGFLEVYKYEKVKELPSLEEGERIPLNEVRIEKDFTKPPPPLSEAELLKWMEKMGLGTKSTRPEMIEVNLQRGYAVREGRRLRGTDLGILLVDLLERCAPELVDPNGLNVRVRKIMDEVLRGKKNYLEAVEEFRREYAPVFEELRSRKGDLVKRVDELLGLGSP